MDCGCPRLDYVFHKISVAPLSYKTGCPCSSVLLSSAKFTGERGGHQPFAVAAHADREGPGGRGAAVRASSCSSCGLQASCSFCRLQAG